MLKRGLIILFLLLLPSVLAQSPDDASALTLKTKISVEIPVSKSVDFLRANVSYFPRSDSLQKTLSLEINTAPPASVTRNEEEIIIYWKKISKEASFQIEGVVKTKQELLKKEEKPSQEYLNPTKFINSDDESIRKLAKEITKDEKDPLIQVFKLGAWTKENINYDLSSLNVEASLPAVKVLEAKEGVCDEITIVFLSLVRSVGIPARYVSGIMYSDAFKEKWVPHAWAEVYLNGEWIPFDVTVGQFMWIDVSHVKMKASQDVDYSSIVYDWQSEGANVEPKEVSISSQVLNSEFVSKESKILSIKPLFKQVYPGSFVPLEIILRNDESEQVSDLVSLTSGPGFFGQESIPVLLEGKEEKSIFLMLKIPKDLASDDDYSTKIEVKDRWNNRFSTQLTFGKRYRKVSLEEAKFLIKKEEQEAEFDHFPELEADCIPTKSSYEIGETAQIRCTLKDKGFDDLRGISICLKEDCKNVDLLKGEEKSIIFEWAVTSAQELEFTFTQKELSKKILSKISILDSPDLKIEKLQCPQVIGKEDSDKISLLLKTKKPVQNAYLLVEGLEPYHLKDFKSNQIVVLPIRGSYFADKNGYVLIYVAYDNLEGNRFETFDLCGIEVKEIGWSEKAFNKVKSFIRYDIPFYISSLN